MRRLLAIAIAASFVLVLGACSASGGDDDAATTTTTTTAADEEETTTTTEDDGPPVTVDDDVAGLTEEDYIEAFTEQLTSGSGNNLALDDEQGECVATAWVDAIGIEALQESGATLDELSDPDFDVSSEVEIDDETGAAVARAFPDCDADLIAEFADLLASDAESAQCLIDEIDPDQFYELLGETFAGGDGESVNSLLMDAAEICGVDL